MFNKMSHGVQTTLCIHVDDILCASADLVEHADLKSKLEAKFKEINYELSTKSSFLGMTIDSSNPGAFSVTMRGFITELLEEYAPGGFATSPANNNLFDFTVSGELGRGYLREMMSKPTASVKEINKRQASTKLLHQHVLKEGL